MQDALPTIIYNMQDMCNTQKYLTPCDSFDVKMLDVMYVHKIVKPVLCLTVCFIYRVPFQPTGTNIVTNTAPTPGVSHSNLFQ